MGEWSYDNEGKMLTVKYPDTYDWQGNPATGRTYTYGYDSMGRITRRNVNGVNTTYTYDSLGRLLTAGTASYTYDGFGNRLQQTSPPMDLTYYASNNRIAATGYAYDDNGSLTATPDLTMSYDVENRLAQAQTPTVTENYRYAPSGQRVWKQKMGSYEWYFYGVDGRLIGTYVRCQYYGTLFQEGSTNVYFGGRTLQAQGQSVMKQDRLGTVGATNYAPYGDTVIYPPPYGDGLGFTGYYRDGTSTGLDYAQQRYYAPAIGRFTTADPYMPSAAIARPQSWNRYAYVENDPINKVDRNGLQPCDPLDPSRDCYPATFVEQLIRLIGKMGEDARLELFEAQFYGVPEQMRAAELKAFTSDMRGEGLAAVNGLVQPCIDAFAKVAKKLNRPSGDVRAGLAATVSNITFYSAGGLLGEITLGQAGGYYNRAVYPDSMTMGDFAWELRRLGIEMGGKIVAAVINSSAIFINDIPKTAGELGKTVLHEILHPFFNLNDMDLAGALELGFSPPTLDAASDRISRFLDGGCKRE